MFGEEIHNEFRKKYNIDKSSLINGIRLNKVIFEKPLSQFEECIAVDLITELGYNIFGVSLNASDFKVIIDKNTVISYDGPKCFVNNDAFNYYYFS